MLLASRARGRWYWLAADKGQGALALDAIGGFADRTPALRSAVEIQAQRVLSRSSGATLEVLAADAPGAWGLLPDGVFVDELAQWTDGPAARRLWEAVSSAVAKNPDARLVVLTTAGSPDHFAYRVLEHARSAPLWRVHERRGPAPWADPLRLEEQRARLPHAVYQQLFENTWTAAEGSFLDAAMIDAAFVLPGPTLGREGAHRYVAGLDLGARHDATAFAIGHRVGQEVVVLDRLMVWQGSPSTPVNFADVEAAILAAHARFRFDLRLDPWQGLAMAQRLRARGIRAEEFTFSQGSKQRLAATLLSTINTGTLRLYEAEGLRRELLGLRLKQSASGAWSFDHTAGGHDDQATALALMTVAALERGVSTVTSEAYKDDGEEPVVFDGDLRLVGEHYVDRE